MGWGSPGHRLNWLATRHSGSLTFLVGLLLAGCAASPGVGTTPDGGFSTEPTVPVVVQVSYGSITLPTGFQSLADKWEQRLGDAVTAIDTAGFEWDQELHLVLDPDAAGFERATGLSAHTAAAGTVCTDGRSRIHLNPALLSQSEEWIGSTLIHEAVHVATGSACVPAEDSLAWAREGLAESVAAASDQTTKEHNRELVQDFLVQHPAPTSLPTSVENPVDYALAQLAVEAVQAQLGSQAEDFLRRAIGQASKVSAAELGQATSWYRAALADHPR